MQQTDKTELFAHMPVPKALAALAIPTIINQLVNLIYNMVDAFFIGRTGNSYMMAATTLTLTLVMMNVAFSNLFGIGGGSLLARLMGAGKTEQMQKVSAFAVWGAILLALLYSAFLGIFLDPILTFLGASEATLPYARQYTLLVLVIGSLPNLLALLLAHLLRNVGYSKQASFGLSSGGILNIFLDPLFMFVLLPSGYEVVGAALATLLSNVFSCVYLLAVFIKTSQTIPLSVSPAKARQIPGEELRELLSVGIPSAILTGLFDVANIFVNMLAAAHNDLILAGMGIVMKIERIPNAINVGICQGMMPIVAYNFSSGDHDRMRETVRTARKYGLLVAAASIVLLELSAPYATRLFLSTRASDAETALLTVGYASIFLRIRCVASPVQFLNYHTSYCMQAMGDGRRTMIHAIVREIIFYIPLMNLLDFLFGELGLASALVLGEGMSALFALFLLKRALKEAAKRREARAQKA